MIVPGRLFCWSSGGDGVERVVATAGRDAPSRETVLVGDGSFASLTSPGRQETRERGHGIVVNGHGFDLSTGAGMGVGSLKDGGDKNRAYDHFLN